VGRALFSVLVLLGTAVLSRLYGWHLVASVLKALVGVVEVTVANESQSDGAYCINLMRLFHHSRNAKSK
jgi:hypothetical protein